MRTHTAGGILSPQSAVCGHELDSGTGTVQTQDTLAGAVAGPFPVCCQAAAEISGSACEAPLWMSVLSRADTDEESCSFICSQQNLAGRSKQVCVGGGVQGGGTPASLGNWAERNSAKDAVLYNRRAN